MKPPVVFVVRELRKDWPNIATFDEASIDVEFERFRRGVDNWIVQGYLRLRRPLEALGFTVRIADRFERNAICIAHRDDLNRFYRPLPDCFVIGVRADRPTVAVAQIEVVQNPLQINSPRARLIQHWPQPNLIPRNPSRGPQVTRAVYYGRDTGIPAWYRDKRFLDSLHELGVSFHVCDHGWNDYSDVDIALAHRVETPIMLTNKPASKLVNAWLGRVPAILAPEPAYEALRHSDLDFIATTDAASTLAAITRLVRSPERYRAMVDNGLSRGAAFGVEAVRNSWLELVVNEAAPGFMAWRASGHRLERWLSFIAALSRQKIEAKRFRARERREKRAMGLAGAGLSAPPIQP